MTTKHTDGWEPITYQALLDKNKLLVDENRALKDEIQSLRAYVKQDKESDYDVDKLDLEKRQAHLLIKADLEALNRIHELSTKLLGSEGIQPILKEIMNAAISVVDAQMGTLQLLEDDSLHIVAHYGHKQPFLDYFTSADNVASVCGKVMQRGERIVIEDIETSSIFAGTPSLTVMREDGVRAIQSTPMLSRTGKLLGILTTQWNFPYSPNEHDLWRLDLLARQAADMIEQARSEEALNNSKKRLIADLNAMTRLHKIGTLFVRESNLEPVLVEIVDAAIAISDADFGNIQLLDPESSELKIVASRGFPKWWLDFWNSVSEGNGTCGTALGCNERVIVEDIEQSPIFVGTPALEIQLKAGIRAVQSTPIVSRSGRLLGMFSTHYKKPHKLQDHDLQLIDLLAQQAADIIERAQIEEMLRKSEERFRVALQGSSIVISSQDCDLRYTWAYNPSLGFNLEDILGKNDYDIYQLDDAETFVSIKKQVLASGVSRCDEVVIHRPISAGGDLFHEMTTEPLLDATGTIGGVICIAVDITERKRAEEALKKANDTLEEKIKERTVELEGAYNSLLENKMRLSEAQKIAHLGNWDWNLLTDEFYWSDEIYNIFGLDSLKFDETYDSYETHDAFFNLVFPEDKESVNNAFKEAFYGKSFEIDFRVLSANREERILYAQGQVIFDEKNMPIRVRGIVQDITERKKTEEALVKLEKIRIKEIHHRIKNNLQVISSLLDLQAEKFEDKKVKQAFSDSQNRVLSMSLIHEELYKGGQTEKLNFSAYLKKLADNLLMTYKLSSINIRLNMDMEENAFLDVDTAVPLGIIVNELITNSLKHAFTEKKEGEIGIQLRRHEEIINGINKSEFCLVVSDNGKGIPEGLKLESVESLGMQLINILVNQLDGELKLNRKKGTEFTVRFKVTEKNT
ncbi:histidine kinase dimerization/phosphoacceptor domain -containing protein [Methanosarcina barkeri]|uniref:Sensory transduction histidine kinase n=1 Tax=Methanosarcina barkeri CM1 TaxID=796385 RepID=A0A0G3CHV7_METBA|nr:histidine kinase dimerization/phosphoacceptor domain -containing protein [Methanosarcina barkeri]AKJ39523.1 sensory transduction histidine kinase [Methanosarcina barkeri CM1]